MILTIYYNIQIDDIINIIERFSRLLHVKAFYIFVRSCIHVCVTYVEVVIFATSIKEKLCVCAERKKQLPIHLAKTGRMSHDKN